MTARRLRTREAIGVVSIRTAVDALRSSSCSREALVLALCTPLLCIHERYDPNLVSGAGSAGVTITLADIAALVVVLAAISAARRLGIEPLRRGGLTLVAALALIAAVIVWTVLGPVLTRHLPVRAQPRQRGQVRRVRPVRPGRAADRAAARGRARRRGGAHARGRGREHRRRAPDHRARRQPGQRAGRAADAVLPRLPRLLGPLGDDPRARAGRDRLRLVEPPQALGCGCGCCRRRRSRHLGRDGNGAGAAARWRHPRGLHARAAHALRRPRARRRRTAARDAGGRADPAGR